MSSRSSFSLAHLVGIPAGYLCWVTLGAWAFRAGLLD